VHQLLLLGLKGVIAGVIVCLVALLSEVVRPPALAGIFSAAPSVALAGLAVTVISAGAVAAWNQSLGMIAGSVALVVYCLVGIEATRRFGALKGAVTSSAVWFATALSLWAVVLR
jgi:hypothetical protein